MCRLGRGMVAQRLMTMRAMVLNGVSRVEHRPLQLEELPVPEPGPGEIRGRVLSCGVCHTEIDEIEGRLSPSSFPMVLGHEVVGVVDRTGPGTTRFRETDRVGIDWLNWACGQCCFCLRGQENLCERAKWTGKDVYGGYASVQTGSVPPGIHLPGHWTVPSTSRRWVLP